MKGTSASDDRSAISTPMGASPLARRIGPSYTIDDIARWLATPAGDPLTTFEIGSQAKNHQLVGVLTDDAQWAFPAWQFDRTDGRLIPRHEVVSLWQRLPHDGVLSDVDLTAWMNTRISSVENRTPAEQAHQRGVADMDLVAAVARLRSRAA